MQKRITELLEAGQFEQHTEELLVVNDELNNVFLRYDRYKRHQSTAPTSGVPSPFQLELTSNSGAPGTTDVYNTCSSSPVTNPTETPVYDNSVPPQTGTDDNIYDNILIDFGPTPPPNSSQTISFPPPAASSPYCPPPYPIDDLPTYSNSSELFDPLATPAVNPPQFQPSSENVDKDKSASSNIAEKESEYKEMEQWLKANPMTSVPSRDEAVSDEFERFLSLRAQDGPQQQQQQEATPLSTLQPTPASRQPTTTTATAASTSNVDLLFSL
jgi:hypothetical protein